MKAHLYEDVAHLYEDVARLVRGCCTSGTSGGRPVRRVFGGRVTALTRPSRLVTPPVRLVSHPHVRYHTDTIHYDTSIVHLRHVPRPLRHVQQSVRTFRALLNNVTLTHQPQP